MKQPELRIHSSVQPDALLSRAVELLQYPADAGNPLLSRWVIQPGRLWERDLRRRLAAGGIVAGLEFGSLRLTLERALRKVCPDVRLMDEGQLFWSVLDLLFRCGDALDAIGLAADSAPARWLEINQGDASSARVQLARMLCGTLDDHATQRPSEVLAWIDGKIPAQGDEVWIAGLARALWGAPSRARPLALNLGKFIGRLDRDRDRTAGLPLSITAVLSGAQPWVYLQALGALTMVCPVNLLVLEICERGLSDSVTTWKSLRNRWRADRQTRDLKSYIEREKWLLPGSLQAYWGEHGIVLQQQLVDLEDYLKDFNVAVTDEPVAAPVANGGRALQVLQQDVRETREPRPEQERVRLAEGDWSLLPLNAPSPLRELEGARDAIRTVLERDPTVNPSDVLMVLADIERYVPLLPAVLGSSATENGPDGLSRIPWHLADRSLRTDSDTMAALLDLMTACAGRLTLPVISDLLAHPAVQARLGFGQEQAVELVAYLKQAGFRWGLKKGDRVDGQPGGVDGMWTLDFAIRRLAAGFVNPDATLDPVGGRQRGEQVAEDSCQVTPLPAFEGLAAGALSNFIKWAEDLEQARNSFRSGKPIGTSEEDSGTWLGWLHEWMPRLLQMDGEREGQSVWLAGVTGELAAGAQQIEPGALFTAEAFTMLFEETIAAFEQSLPIGRGIGGMTVASPRMARTLPARVIAVVGLCDGAWPRQDPIRPRGLLEKKSPGDRMRREEDRLVTLEWVLAAGSSLIWTWKGRDQQSGAEIPASVVVGELLDVCGGTFANPGDIVRRLPLHAFDPACFREPLKSFDRIAAAAAAELQNTHQAGALQPVAPAALPVNMDIRGVPGAAEFIRTGKKPEWTADIWVEFASQLARFWDSPARAFLRRTGLDTEDEFDVLPEREALELDALARWEMRDMFISELLRPTAAPAQIQRRMQAAGMLPPGAAAGNVTGTVLKEATDILAAAQSCAAEGGVVVPVREMFRGRTERLIRVTASSVSAKVLLRAHIQQLALGALHNMKIESTVVGGGKKTETALPACEPGEALARLRVLAALAVLGSSVPLPFFPAASAEQDDGKAAEVFAGGSQSSGGVRPEAAEPACRIAFRGVDPLTMRLPAPPQGCAADWRMLTEAAGLDEGLPLFAQLRDIVYGFVFRIEELKKQERLQKTALKSGEADGVKAGKTRRKEKAS